MNINRPEDWVHDAFRWEDQPEGYDFWSDLSKKWKGKDYGKNFPYAAKILHKTPVQVAMIALSLNKKQPIDKMWNVADKLAPLDNGHNKFLEFIDLYILHKAPRRFWIQFATYRTAVSSSESTMHTLHKDEVVEFTHDTSPVIIEEFLKTRNKDNLPEGFYQKRVIKFNLKTLRNMYNQRKNHKMPDWQWFLNSILAQIPEEAKWILDEKE
jgi:hypothetical protein